ncbi:MAG TPA: sulfatase [Candidatus Limnocylindrales bacterium]|nr:sulfatase [Candidatus Limnocylindrales bacterium]
MLSLAVLAAFLGAAAAGCRREPVRPYVLLVTIDTLRADHCSTYGYRPDTTPVMTRLAQSGVLFRAAYAPSATTAPSHAALLTGRHFRGLGVLKNGHVVADDAQTIAEALAEQGYATAGFVSSYPVISKFGFDQGFQVYDDEFLEEEASLGRRNGGITHDRLAEATANRFIAWLKKRHDDKPVFAWVHFVDPHFPYRAPEKFDGGWSHDVASIIRKYDAEIRYADRHLGRIVDEFERAAGDAGALIIVTSDHGEGLGDHGWKSHGINLYEEAVRIPLVARWTGHLPAGRVVETPVSLVDVAPSILSAIGAAPLAISEGDDMFGDLDEGRLIFLQRRAYKNNEVRGKVVRGEMTAVVQRDSKYITAPDEKRRELYDLRDDPKEVRDLLRKPDVITPLSASPPPAPAGDAGAGAAAPDAGAARAGDVERRAELYDAELERWRQATPVPDNEVPLDKESLQALRALGYVE